MDSEPSFLEQLVEAQTLYITGTYSLARERLTKALEGNSNNYDALLARGYTSLKLNDFEDAFKDAEAAVNANSNRSEALLLKGIVLLNTGKYDEALREVSRAKLLLSTLQNNDPRRVEAELWEQKISAEKSKRVTVSVQNLNKKPEELKIQNGTTAPASVQHHPQPGKVTYRWRQTDSRVYVDINYGLKNKDDLKIKIESKRVEVSFPIGDSRNFELNLELFDQIDAEKSSYNILLDKIEVQLEKQIKERNWTLLEGPNSTNEKVLETVSPKPVVSGQVAQSTPSYPSSSKVKRDWSKIDAEIDEDMKKNKDDYVEGDPLNKFFQEIYKNSDENTRKAMMKSFQTSGGTVLSTNWDEVKSKDYEGSDKPEPAKGQEWRKWEK